MAYEASLVRQLGFPVPFTVSNSVGIEKGAVLKISDPNTAATSTAPTDQIAGIAAAEKIASDGNTQLAVHTQRGNWFKVYLSGSCAVGDPAILDYNNFFKSGVSSTGATLSGSRICGKFLETGTTGETVLMEWAPVTLGV